MENGEVGEGRPQNIPNVVHKSKKISQLAINEGDVPDILAVTEQEAAKMMGRAVQSMRNDRHLGRGCPYIKLGRSIRYLVVDIHAHLQANRIDPGS